MIRCLLLLIALLSISISCSTKPKLVISESFRYGRKVDLDTFYLSEYSNEFQYLNFSGQPVFKAKVERGKLSYLDLDCDLIEDLVVNSNGKSYPVLRFLFDDTQSVDEEMEILYSTKYGILAEKGILFNAGHNRYFLNDNSDLIESLKNIEMDSLIN